MNRLGEPGASATGDPWTHRLAHINGVDCHYVEAGAGEVVLFLHGFPEFWYSWRRQLGAVASAGFRAVAPDLRGYNESGKPAGIWSYRPEMLEEDIVALVRHLGVEQIVLVGHDWGGIIAWRVAMLRPEIVRRLVILNAPHPISFARELRRPEQMWRSWYILFFQLPWLPERFLRAGNFRLLAQALRTQPVHPGAFTSEEIEQYRRAFAQPGALTAMLNYYRAVTRRPDPFANVKRIEAPTLVIWGEQDPYLGINLTKGLDAWVSDLRIERIADASHWVQQDASGRVNELLLEFLGIAS